MEARSSSGSFSTPAPRVASDRLDVWSIVNEAAAISPIQPIVNLGQGFFGFNPPQFAIDAAKEALNRVDCNQCAPTKGRLSLRKAIASAYSKLLERPIDEENEVTITSGANEGMLCALLAFIHPGDEVVTFEPFFDHHNPVGKVFTETELQRIGDFCLKHDLLILSDEVYDHLYYVPFTRIATISPDLYDHTLTVASAGKAFHATGWRIGYLIGPQQLIKYVSAVHTRICYSSVSPLQEAVAVAFEAADRNGFWEHSRQEMKDKMRLFCEVFEDLGLPEIGVAAIPPSEFYSDDNAHIGEDFLRFAFCKEDEVLEMGKQRLLRLKSYIV
ncbi:unnamed protein product [Aspergillus niger]|nr:unnamed protein product [Aspergillus niger]